MTTRHDLARTSSAEDGPLRELVAGGWGFHGFEREHFFDMGLGREPLEFIAERVGAGDRTLETGSGYSTVAFALAGAIHTAISPISWEHERIATWCGERGISTTDVTFIEGRSQDVLPTLSGEPLDVVLIDGDHAFPVPFIDFYYAADRLRPGGLLIVDDTHIRTGELLDRFLSVEEGRWKLERRFSTTSAFVKLGDVLLDPGGWMSQPFCAQPRPPRGASLGAEMLYVLRPRRRLAAARSWLAERRGSR